MNANSAAIVPFAGNPDNKKQSKSHQLRINGSVITPSMIREKDPVNLMTLGACWSKAGANLPTVNIAPKW
jgi:hypothetical protein